MKLDESEMNSRRKLASDLRRRHFAQIHNRPADRHQDLQSVYAITYRPGDWTGHFIGKHLRVAGCSTVVVLSYEDVDKRNRKRMPFRGYSMDFHADGTGSYGVHAGDKFCYEAA